MKKFYINDREIETVEGFLRNFMNELFDYTEYITELSGVELDIISEELSNIIQIIRDGGEYQFNWTNYRVEQDSSDE